MFDGCCKLKLIIGINNFNTINVTTMKGMFKNCNELENLDLSGFNTSNVTNMERMFKKCCKLKKIKGINNFDIKKVSNMNGMFEECNELEYLILSKFNASNTVPLNKNFINELNEEKEKVIKLKKVLNNIMDKIIAVTLFHLTKQLTVQCLAKVQIFLQNLKKNFIMNIQN